MTDIRNWRLHMLTDEEAKKAAEELKAYCGTKSSCQDCPFVLKIIYCTLRNPTYWKLENTNG